VIGIGAIAPERLVKVELNEEVARARAMATLPRTIQWIVAILFALGVLVWFATR
jgi:hypothetical protein